MPSRQNSPCEAGRRGRASPGLLVIISLSHPSARIRAHVCPRTHTPSTWKTAGGVDKRKHTPWGSPDLPSYVGCEMLNARHKCSISSDMSNESGLDSWMLMSPSCPAAHGA